MPAPARALGLVLVLLVACDPGRPSRDRDEEEPIPPVCEATGTCPPPLGGDGGDPSGDGGVPQEDPDGWPPAWAALEDEMLALVNALRTQGGRCPSGDRPPVAPLVMDPSLRTAARLHSKDMGENDYFDHFSLDGRDPFTRMRDAGYDGQPGGENIAGGASTAQGAFEMWLSSDGHCRNMTSSSFNEIGIGYASVQGSPFGSYWTQTFGTR